MSNPLQRLIEGVVSAIEPLALAADDPELLADLLDALGANDPAVVDAGLLSALRALSTAAKDVRAILAAPDLSLSTAQSALDALRTLVVATNALGASAGAAYPQLGADLLDVVLTSALHNASTLLYQIFAALGLVQTSVLPPLTVGGRLIRAGTPIDRLVLGNLGALLKDPIALIKPELPTPRLSTVANAQKTADVLVDHLSGVLSALGVTWSYGVTAGDERFLGDAIATAPRTLIVYLPYRIAKGAVAGISITLSSADTGDLGVVLTPFGTLDLQGTAGSWNIVAQLSAAFGALAFGGGKGTQILTGVGSAGVHGGIKATLPATTGAPALTIGSATGTRLELGQPQASIGLNASTSTVEAEVATGTGPSALVIAPGDADSFLAEILPVGGLRAAFDLGLAWSNVKGLTFGGSAGLDATIPMALAVGPVTLSSVHLGIQTQPNGSVVADISASVAASIGPIRANVDRIGIRSGLSFPTAGGNLGSADLSLGFKPPTQVGLSIDVASVVTGSGFLFYDTAQGMYVGGMQLALHDSITLTALGLISTRLPDGQPGYSLLIFITAEGFQPIQLGLGFTLTAIGGMVGVNRTFDETVLRAGLKNDTLATLLFPKDPAANATAVVRSLASAFPAKAGSYLLGLMARICWGTPTLLQFDLALIVELGARTRLLTLGRMTALLPSPDNDLVRLKLDAVGVIDFDEGTIALDAALVDSRLLHKFAISGSGAFRAGWGSGAGSAFVLAIGGFNPRFAPPAGVPPQDRVTIALSAGANPQLTCEAYFAMTSNTLQFGARAQLMASAGGFTLLGDVGFDVLMSSLSHFVADFHASVQLKRGSYNLFKVGVEGTLEGVRPLTLSGKATFEILWCDFSVHFHTTLVDGPQDTVATVDALPLLAAALGTASNWKTIRSATPHGVTLRGLPAGAGLVVEPLGQLAVTQSVLPLGTERDIDLLGGARVGGRAKRFTLGATLTGAGGTMTTAVQGEFAPGQYFAMSDDAKLASPSFETRQAGLAVGSTTAVTDLSASALVAATVSYTSLVLDGPTLVAVGVAVQHALSPAKLAQHVETGAAARAPVRQVGRARFGTGADAAVTVRPARWAIVPLMGGAAAPLAPAALTPAATTWSEQRATVDALNQGGARWQLVPTYEIAS